MNAASAFRASAEFSPKAALAWSSSFPSWSSFALALSYCWDRMPIFSFAASTERPRMSVFLAVLASALSMPAMDETAAFISAFRFLIRLSTPFSAAVRSRSPVTPNRIDTSVAIDSPPSPECQQTHERLRFVFFCGFVFRPLGLDLVDRDQVKQHGQGEVKGLQAGEPHLEAVP